MIAKICERKTAEVESAVYEELLPRLPMPSLRYYGKVRDGDREHCWLFLEDAGGEGYSPADPEHRRLAARWLATVQLHAPRFSEPRICPTEDRRHYLVHLLEARAGDREAAAPARSAAADAAPVLEDLLSKLDLLEARWGELAATSATRFPRRSCTATSSRRTFAISRNGRESGSPSSTGRWRASGFRPPIWRSCWSPSAPRCARRQPTEAARSVLREPLPRHLPLRAERLGNGAGAGDRRASGGGRKRVPMPRRHRLDLLAGHGRPGIRWTTSGSTRDGSARPCRMAGWSARGPKRARAEMTADSWNERPSAELQACLREALRGPSRSDSPVTSSSRSTCIVCGSRSTAPSVRWSPSGPILSWRAACRLVARRWLPAVGLEDQGPPLLAVAAEPTGEGAWHVYDDLHGRPLSTQPPVEQRGGGGDRSDRARPYRLRRTQPPS